MQNLQVTGTFGRALLSFVLVCYWVSWVSKWKPKQQLQGRETEEWISSHRQPLPGRIWCNNSTGMAVGKAMRPRAQQQQCGCNTGKILRWRLWERLSPEPGSKGTELWAESSSVAAGGAAKELSSNTTPESEGKEDSHGVAAIKTHRAAWLWSVEIREEQRAVSL